MATVVGAEEQQQGEAALQWHRAGGGQGQPAQGGGVGALAQGETLGWEVAVESPCWERCWAGS